MTITSGRVPMVAPADDVVGPGQGKWTYEDYAKLQDDGKRYEIVDGVLFMTPSPSRWHQKASGRFFRYLSQYVEDTGLGEVYEAPFDVQLAYNVIVQPDVLVVLNAGLHKITDSRVIGAPDLVVEVASPGSVGHDRDRKKRAYARAGVTEYWIADPWSRTVEVLVLGDGEYRSLGVFERQAILPSKVVPNFPVHVEHFFA